MELPAHQAKRSHQQELLWKWNCSFYKVNNYDFILTISKKKLKNIIHLKIKITNKKSVHIKINTKFNFGKFSFETF